MIPSDISLGDRLTVVFERTVFEKRGTHKRTKRDVISGKVIAMPSSKFDRPQDTYDLDFRTDSDIVFSVDLFDDTLTKLVYEAGGDREIDEYTISEVQVE